MLRGRINLLDLVTGKTRNISGAYRFRSRGHGTLPFPTPFSG